MRISFLAHKLDRSGGSSFSLDLMARHLTERGHSVRVITTNMFRDNNPPENPPYEIVSDALTNRTKMDAIPNIYEVLSTHESVTDLYHIFNTQYHGVAGIFARNSETPVVGRLNSYDGFCTNPKLMDDSCYRQCTLRKKIKHNDQQGLRNAVQLPQILYQHLGSLPTIHLDRLFALSPTIKNAYEENGIDGELIDVVPNFYDPNFGCEADLSESSGGPFRITYVGRLRAEKAPDILLRALTILEPDPEELQVDVLGDGPMLDDLEEYTQSHRLGDVVTFHGWVDNTDIPEFLAQGDVFVHPGRWPEPFGRVILEAMQCQSPPIVSDIGAPPWVVGEAGVTFSRGDVDELAAQISALQADTDRLTELKAACSSRLEAFGPEQVIADIEAKYEEVTQ